MRFALAVAPLLLGFVALAMFDLADDSSAMHATRVEQAHARLVVLIVDSLDARDVAHLPALRTRSPGLHGEVRACVDGVTIPCVTAMIHGYDRASGFSPLRNFGAARELVPRSVLGALERNGVRVGYFGDPLLARALAGLHEVQAIEDADDARALRSGLAALGHLDVVLIHLLGIDEAAHKFGAEAPAYEEARRSIDLAIERTFSQLSSDDHLVVLGDHGHALSGRHSADMGTTTYAAYYGPRFARGAELPMQMTDHAALWARLFGLRWGEHTLADDYFAARPLHASAHLTTRERKTWPLLLACALAGLIAAAGAARRPRAIDAPVAGLATLGIALDAWLATRAATWLSSVGGALAASLWLGGSGALLRKAAGQVELRTALLTGALLWALPTAEPTAGIKAPMLWLVVLLAMHRSWRAGAAALVLLALAMVRVQAFLPRVLLEPGLDARLAEGLPALLLIAAVWLASDARAALCALGGSLIALVIDVDSRWLMLPCALVLPLAFAALRVRACFAPLCLLLPIACSVFFPRDSASLAAVCASWLAWALVPRALREQPPELRAAAFVVLMWVSFWTAMSTRIGGIDYDFYFRWLPTTAGAMDQAIPQGLLTAAKCMLPVVFGALLARRAEARHEHVLELAATLTAVRLALTLVFVAAASLLHADVQALYDATQEVAFWLLMYAVLGLVSAAHPRAT
ncbi:MAG: alkaline phosphatase family protein [Polyangiales bacterium]